MFTKPYGVVVRERRERDEYSQKSLAEQAGLTASGLCQIELGHRQPSGEVRLKLQQQLGPIKGFLEPSGLTKTLQSNGRRCLDAGRPYEAPRDRPSYVRFAHALRKYPVFVNDIMPRIRRRKDFDECQSLCHRIALESAEESLLVLRLLERGALPCFVAPGWTANLPHGIVDPLKGTDVGYRPTACLGLDGEFFFFQVTMRSPEWQHRVDVLHINEGVVRVIEVDGYGHTADADLKRERQIGLPTTRLAPEMLLDLTCDFLTVSKARCG